MPAPFEQDRRARELYLARRLRSLEAPKRLADAIRHAALAPGKRLRPLLVFLGYAAVKGDPQLRKPVLPAAGPGVFGRQTTIIKTAAATPDSTTHASGRGPRPCSTSGNERGRRGRN